MGIAYDDNRVIRPDLEYEWSKEMIQEYTKCAKSSTYFALNHAVAIHPMKGIIPLEVRSYQLSLLDKLSNNKLVLGLYGRQSGKSLILCIHILHMALYSDKPVNIFMLAHKGDMSKQLLMDLKVIYEELPPYLKKGVKKYDATTIEFEDGSKIRSGTTTPDTIRGQSISFLLLDEFAFVQPHIVDGFWTSAQPTLSCLTGDTMILTENGYRRIDSYIPQGSKKGDYIPIDNLSVFGRNGIEEASHFYVSPKGKVKKIITKYGYSIQSTFDHPLEVMNDDGVSMIKTLDIKVGDSLTLYHSMEKYGNIRDGDVYSFSYMLNKYKTVDYDIKMTKDIAYMLGGYLAEGWYVKRNNKTYKEITICNSDKEFIDVFLNNGFSKLKIKNRNDKFKSYIKIFNLMDYFLSDINNCRSWEKYIPTKIFELSKELQYSFISGYIDGDGCVYKDGSITMNSTSRELLSGIQLLLLNMGIVSNLSKVPLIIKERKDNYNIFGRRDSYSLKINRSFSHVIKNKFDLRISRKRDRLINKPSENYIDKQLKVYNYEFLKNEIKSIMKNNNITAHTLRHKYGIRIDKILLSDLKTFKYDTLLKIIKCFEDYSIKSTILDYFKDKKMFFDEIVSIEEINDVDTYDLTCPNTHTFLQNGILGSNTGGSCCVISTPNGASGLFYELYKGAKNSEDGGEGNGFKLSTVDYKEVPRGKPIDEWEDETINTIGQVRFNQEYKCLTYDNYINIIDTTTGKKESIKIGELYERENIL